MLQRGDHIDEWVVEAALGHGGMGSVYRCHHKDASSMRVAVKVLADQLREDPDAQARFVREAEILHRLDHPGVVKIRNVRVDHDPPFLEMEFIEGDTLESVLEHGKVEIDLAVEWGVALFDALDYLHKHDVQHRDVKPANVLIEHGTGRLVLVDFGLALVADLSRLTSHGVAFGTVAYAPPEWLNPDTLDPVSWDLYAGGVLIWEMITGRVPFPASGIGAPRQQALQVMLSKQSAPPLDPGEGPPPLLRVIIRELTHPKPDHRPQLAAEVLARLRMVEDALRDGWDNDVTPASVSRSFPHVADLVTEIPAPARKSGSHDLPPASLAPVPISQGSMAVGGGALLACLLLAGWWLSRDNSVVPSGIDLAEGAGAGQQVSRPVLVALSGGPLPSAVDLKIDGQRGTVDGETLVFDEVRLGSQSVDWAYGHGCTVELCPGESCKSWCASDSTVLTVEAGEGPQHWPLSIRVPRRMVTVGVPSMKPDERRGLFKRKELPAMAVRLNKLQGEVENERAVFKGVVPGHYTLEVSLGDCPEEAVGCSGRDDCPDGCSSVTQASPISWHPGPKAVNVDIALPE